MYARAYKYFFFKSHLKKKFLVYDQSTIRLGENKKINLSISLIFPQYTQVFNFM